MSVASVTGVSRPASPVVNAPVDVAVVSLGNGENAPFKLSGLEIAVLGAFSQSPRTLHAASYTLTEFKEIFGGIIMLAAQSDQYQSGQKTGPSLASVIAGLKEKNLIEEKYNRLYATEKLLRLYNLVKH